MRVGRLEPIQQRLGRGQGRHGAAVDPRDRALRHTRLAANLRVSAPVLLEAAQQVIVECFLHSATIFIHKRFIVNPQVDNCLRDTLYMILKQILARRLRALMDSRLDLNTQTKVAQRAGVGQATVQRILTQQAAATLDSIDSLAHAFRVSPVDLLLGDDREAQLLRAWSKLDADDKARVLHYVELAAGVPARQTSRARQEFVDTAPAPPSVRAALSRAAARKVSTASMIDPSNEKGDHPAVPARRKRGGA